MAGRAHHVSSASATPKAGRWCPMREKSTRRCWRASLRSGLEIGSQPAAAARLAQLDASVAAAARSEGGLARIPTFCAGCPHNGSTKVPEGSRALAGIGCHYMAQWMDRETSTFTHMGGEGMTWVGQAPFVTTPHVFQNLGDGTYFHSGHLAIRHAPGHRHAHHLQDPVQRCGGHDRRPGARWAAHAGGHCTPGARRGRERGGRGQRRSAQVRARLLPARRDGSRARAARCRAAQVARATRRDGADLRPDLRRGKAPPPQEGQPGGVEAPRLHQRSGLRRLRRLRRAIELCCGGAAGDRVRPQTQDQPIGMQQGPVLRERLLPELRHGRWGDVAQGAGGQDVARRARELAGSSTIPSPGGATRC